MTTAIKNIEAKTKTVTYKIARKPDTLLTVTISHRTKSTNNETTTTATSPNPNAT